MQAFIRQARLTDYTDVKEIMDYVQRMHVNWRPDIYKPNDNYLTQEIFSQIVESGSFYVAELNGKAVGVLEISYKHIENPTHVTRDIVFIDTLAVASDFRRKGIAHLLLNKAKEIKETSGADGLELQVNAKNEAAYEMYKHCGFSEKSINLELL